jgi:uncharacterized membrane protein
MSDFIQIKPIPKWRAVFYGFIAAAVTAGLGYLQDDHHLYFGAPFFGVFIGAFAYFVSWVRASAKNQDLTALIRIRAIIRWLFIIGVFAGIVATVLDFMRIFHKK